MSENHSSDQVLEVSGAQNSNFLDPNPDHAIRAPQEANVYDHDQVNQVMNLWLIESIAIFDLMWEMVVICAY